MIVELNPTFSAQGRTVSIPATEINVFTSSVVRDNINQYQSRFGVFGFMGLNDRMKFTITKLTGTPFMWQPVSHCTWTPTGNLSITKDSITPSEAMIQEEFCQDELVNSMFAQFLATNNRGLSPEGQRIFNQVVTKITEQATLGAWLTLTIGKLYDPTTVNFKDGTDATIESLFSKTIGTVRGWVELLKEMAASEARFRHLNIPAFSTDEFDGDRYLGDPVALFDKLYDAAPSELSNLIDEGGVPSTLGTSSVLFIVSTSIFRQVAALYRKQGTEIITLRPRLTQKDVSGITVYYLDDIPIIPVSYISHMDAYLKGKQHFAALTLSGNIQLGTSFGAVPNVNAPNVGIIMQQKTNLDELGRVLMRADSLFTTAIADHRYICAAQVFVEAA